MSVILPPAYSAWRRTNVSPLVRCAVCRTVSTSCEKERCSACNISMKQTKERIEKDIARFESAFGIEFQRDKPIFATVPNEFSAMMEELAKESEPTLLLNYDLEDDNESQRTIAIVQDNEYVVEYDSDRPTPVVDIEDEDSPTLVFEKPTATLVFEDCWEDEDTELSIPLVSKRMIDVEDSYR